MNFASFQYLVFLVIVLYVYFKVNNSLKPVFLLLASYVFYSSFGLGFALIMLATTSITFITSRYCYDAKTKQLQTFYFFSGLFADLMIFVLFKYFHIIDTDIMNWPHWSVQKLLIPIGISFYTFKTLGYCIDVYKRKYAPESSFIYYALSVSFFPQLIAGPIEKSVIISAQLKQSTDFKTANFIEGSKLILWGLFKKIVIADSIAQMINPVFANVHDYKGLDFTFALIGFTYQIYADFSGYSDIAIGTARCFNVELPANFNKPFFSKNYREFWIRWHITFSKWLKEYVFDALGGISKTSKAKTVFNIFVLFLIVGLWHGATLNYILYAQLAFLFMLLDIVTRNIRKRLFPNKKSLLNKVLAYLSMIFLIVVLSAFFRPVHLQDSLYIYKNFLVLHTQNLSAQNIAIVFCYILVLEFFQYFQVLPNSHCFQKVHQFRFRAAMYVFMVFAILLLNSRPEVTFQYFQF